MKLKLRWSSPSPEKPTIVEVKSSIKETIAELENKHNDKILFFNLV